ncbi:MAG: ribosome assembly cofactor RimP [Prolixibacteraceae bacterium]|nr:ribosome assembly cofactor RimP [Prolixibacteraceae bacterium]MBN2774767.1 ribosome assembly cofactor RimP [Prolixibacteraceae bacterium]
MIKREKIETLVKEKLEEGIFLVGVNVSKSNVIDVFIDSMEGVTIDQCVTLSRAIESALDRDTEDFELMVSSAGLGQPFKVIEQYYKNEGREVEVVSVEGKKNRGILSIVDENGIVLLCAAKEKVEGKKKKQLTEIEVRLDFKNIKTAKTVISF